MREKILSELKGLERTHGIRILMAVSYGSRCFGYASQESDWDVRFIYVHRPVWYFSIVNERDVIEQMDNESHLDVGGYELRKALNLLARTNPILSDWLHADDYYIIDEAFRDQMLAFERECYNTHHAMHHFYSISVKHNQRYMEDGVTLKRFIYYMRGLLSCRWLGEHGTHPPVSLDTLIDATIVDNATVRAKAHGLLELKREGKRHDLSVVDRELVEYVMALQRHYSESLRTLADTKPKADLPAMSAFLMKRVLGE